MSIRPLMHCALFATAFAAAGLLAVFAAPAATAQNSTITPRVKEIYKMDCAVCHGDNGNGKTDVATSLGVVLLDYTDPKSLAGKPDQELFDVIRKGKDKMPPEDVSRAKDAEVHGLIAYIRGMSKGQTSATAAPAPGPAPAAAPATKPQKP